MIWRRRLFSACAIAALLIPFDVGITSASAPLTILYLSASDCPNCRGWEQFKRPDFVRSPEGQRVPIREISRVSLGAPVATANWPDDLKWVQSATTVPQATPGFILIQANKVLTVAWGASGFDRVIVPYIRQALTQ